MKGIIFGPESVGAILEGRKTMTRRPMKPQPILQDKFWVWNDAQWVDGGLGIPKSAIDDYACYQPGEILYVKETWAKVSDFVAVGIPDGYIYQAPEWKSPLFMPKESARLFVRIEAVRAERLWEITPEGCIAEGVITDICQMCISNGGQGRTQLAEDVFCGGEDELFDEYSCLWDKLNPRNPWDSDPWVWVYTFERVEKP